MKLDKVERILYPFAIALIIILFFVQLWKFEQRMQSQIDTMQAEIAGNKAIAQARAEYIEAKLDYVTHPAVMNQRQIDWMMGVFKE